MTWKHTNLWDVHELDGDYDIVFYDQLHVISEEEKQRYETDLAFRNAMDARIYSGLAELLAREKNCLVVHTEWDLQRNMYVSSIRLRILRSKK